MTQDEILSIQTEANNLVFEGRKVHVEVEELNSTDEQSKITPKLESGRSVGRGLPEDYTGGVKRVVVIQGVDRNPWVFIFSLMKYTSFYIITVVVELICQASTISSFS